MKADKIIGVLLIAFSAFMYYEADILPEGTFGTLGAGLFPKILFILMAVSGITLIAGAFIQERKSKSAAEKTEKESSETIAEILQNHKNVILAFVIFFGYVVLMYFLGYQIASVIFMPVLMWVLGPRDKKSVIITVCTTIVVTFVIHYSFLHFLKIFLPTGKLF